MYEHCPFHILLKLLCHLFIIVIVSFLSRSDSLQCRQLVISHSRAHFGLVVSRPNINRSFNINLLTFPFAIVCVVVIRADILEPVE